MVIESAIEVFVRGFAFTRSFTHPYVAERISPGVWVLRDAPRARGSYRGEEYVAHAVPAAALDALARQHTRDRFRLCAVRDADEPDAGIRADFRALGYRLMTTEPLMIHRLGMLGPMAEPFPVTRVTTQVEAELLRKAAGSRQILPEYLMTDPAPMRQYMATDQGTPVGWVGSVVVGTYAWCTSMFVNPAYRRRGIARSLLTRMLRDDKAAGGQASVLLASHAGGRLYPTVGYKTVGELLMFTPPRIALAQ